MAIDPSLYKVELTCSNGTVSSEEVCCSPEHSLNVTVYSLATNEQVENFNLTKEQLRCMDGDVMDIFFNFENQTITSNVTDANSSNSTNSTGETALIEDTYEITWRSDSCMEPWKHTL